MYYCLAVIYSLAMAYYRYLFHAYRPKIRHFNGRSLHNEGSTGVSSLVVTYDLHYRYAWPVARTVP